MSSKLLVQVQNIFHIHSQIGTNNFLPLAGDMPRGGRIDDIAYLLDRGVRVALIYGNFFQSHRLHFTHNQY